MPRFVHFELPAKDPQKVAAFYRTVFGWQVEKWDGPVDYWTVMSGEEGTPGINGGLYTPNPGMAGTINTLEVDDLDTYVRKVEANGGKVVAPRMAIPSVGYLAYVADVEGTVFGMMQNDPTVGQT